MGIIEMTVTSCLHLIRSNLDDLLPLGIGSGVIIRYKNKYFLCTVAHFSDKPGQNVGLVTGRVKDNQTEIYYFGEFSYLTKITYEEDLMDIEDLEYCFQNPDKSGSKLDIAFREIELLENVIQDERVFNLNGVGTITVNRGGKSYLIVDDDYEIDTNEFCSFYGRIRPDFSDGIFNFKEALYWGLSIESVGNTYIKMDLGRPISDHKNFKGCSGAPIIDTRGRLIGLITHGDEDPQKSGIYGIRFDKVKQWIDLMYFQEPMKNM
jgi:hypothetical protein